MRSWGDSFGADGRWCEGGIREVGIGAGISGVMRIAAGFAMCISITPPISDDVFDLLGCSPWGYRVANLHLQPLALLL